MPCEPRAAQDPATSGPFPASRAPFFLSITLGLCLLSCSQTPSSPPQSSATPKATPDHESDSPSFKSQKEEAAGPPPFRVGGSFRLEKSEDLVGVTPKHFSTKELTAQKLKFTKQPASGESRFIALDSHPPRRASQGGLRMLDLINEDEEMAPGVHQLTFYSMVGETIRHQVHAFSVETRPEALVPANPCLLLLPFGTMNGPLRAETIRIVAVPLSEEVSHMRLRVEGASLRGEQRVERGQEMILTSPPQGDVSFRLTCFDGTKELSSVERTITINGDAPDSEVAR